MQQQQPQEQVKALEAFGIDLTAQARAGKLGPVIESVREDASV